MPLLICTNAMEVQDAQKQPRRGVTAMEYLMMISLILVACLVAIGYLGANNNANMSTSSSAINKFLKKGS
jgi:hypothetical protein